MDTLFAGTVHLHKSVKLQTFTKENLTALSELIVDVTVNDIYIPKLNLFVTFSYT